MQIPQITTTNTRITIKRKIWKINSQSIGHAIPLYRRCNIYFHYDQIFFHQERKKLLAYTSHMIPSLTNKCSFWVLKYSLINESVILKQSSSLMMITNNNTNLILFHWLLCIELHWYPVASLKRGVIAIWLFVRWTSQS